jgi:hypothetical protein
LYTNSINSLSIDVEKFIVNEDVNLLKNNKFTHIIMLKTCADFAKYDSILKHLEDKNLIKKDFSTIDISIYKIQ